MINRREGKGPPSRDLLVCFPTRSHLTLMPKAVSSPRRHHHHHQKQLNHLRKSMRGGASPYLKQMSAENLSEPTSPKVTCAGQIKVRSRTGGCKNWQTVMDEIERLHINRKTKKKPNWVEALGFKKEVMQFLACLRRIKFDFRCMGSFPHVDVTSDDDEDNDELGGNNDKEIDQNQDIIIQDDEDDDEEVSSRTIFSKWFMVLQENNQGVFSEDEKSLKTDEKTEDHLTPCLPPANALLLMRCRSAPAKSWMEEKQEEEERHEKDDDDDDDGHDEKVEEEEHADDNGDDDDKKKVEKKEKKRKSLMELMKNDESEFYKLSSDIVKETWVIGGIHKDPFSRSRSWKR